MRNRLLLFILGLALIAAIVLYTATGWFSFLEPQQAAPGSEGGLPGLLISEVMSRNAGCVPDENGEFSDWIEIYNPTPDAIDLAGYGLSDTEDEVKWRFADASLSPGGYAAVFLSDSAGFKLKAGETAVLTHAGGSVLDAVVLADAGADVSVGRSASNSLEWEVFDLPTPGFANTPQGRADYERSMDASDIGLVVSELMASNRTALADEDGGFYDWIEIHNPTGAELDLSGFGLSDDPLKPLKWRFPEGTALAPGEYLLVYASGASGAEGLHANFRLAAYAESVTLSDARARRVYQTAYTELAPDASWALAEGEWTVSGRPTPGFSNDDAGYAAYQAAFE